MPRPIVPGVNDLQSQFPEIAAEAYGWDPSTIAKASGNKVEWKCSKGHIYTSKVSHRTGSNSGCPVCDGKKVLPGFNDLKTKFPDVAAEAFGWDPTDVTAVNGKKLQWQCNIGHIFSATVASRTTGGCGCPVCSGRQVLPGFNDLKTKFPDVAAEAFGWDSSTVVAGSVKKQEWKCKEGHKYHSAVIKRTSNGSGCPFCSGHQVLAGFNDLQSYYPDIAAEAYKWDPTTVTSAANQKKDWKCKEGHIYSSAVNNRTNGKGCPFCAGRQVLKGFNDLQTKFPDLAAEAFGWDPTTITSGSGRKLKWECSFGHIYSATVGSRTNIGSGCPVCAEYGFNPSMDAWFYLMQRPGEQQLGITNELDVRMKTHERNGWVLLEHTVPASGQKVLDTENAFKKWLKKEIGLMKGSTENWSTTKMEVQSLAELKARSGIETDLF